MQSNKRDDRRSAWMFEERLCCASSHAGSLDRTCCARSASNTYDIRLFSQITRLMTPRRLLSHWLIPRFWPDARPAFPRISDVPASRVEFDILLVCTQSPQSDTDSNSSYSTESKQQPVAGMDNPTYRSYPPPLHEYSIKQKQNPGQIVPKPVRICSTHRLHRGRGCGRRRLCRGAGNSFTAHGDFRE